MAFHQLLRDYMNGVPSPFWRISRKINPTAVCLGYSSLGSSRGTVTSTINLEEYTGTNRHILDLRDYLKPVSDDLLSVVLHGSAGDGRLTGYSDLDALVIIRNEVFSHPSKLVRLAKVLSAARMFMYRFDPLQHHGWFVLTEQDLLAYPEFILPLEAIREGCVLLGENNLTVSSMVSDKAVYQAAARRLVRKLHQQLSDGWRPKNAYQLKSLLSEFMMLPVLYQQAIFGKGCSKRESFVKVSGSFKTATWNTMEEVSHIRQRWSYRPGFLGRKILCNSHPFFYFLRKHWPSAVPTEIKPVLNSSFYDRLLLFTTEMEGLLEAQR